MVGTQARPRGLRVRFAYANVDEFVTTYAYYSEAEAVFAPTDKVIPAQSEVAFSLELSDGSPMLRGLGVVLECWESDDNRFGRRGVYIGLSQLTATSQAIHARMLWLRQAEEEENTEVTQIPPRRRAAPDTIQQFGAPEVEETDDGEMKRSITQEMAAVPDPSIPMAIEDNKANSTSRYEGLLRGPAFPAKQRAQSPIPVAADSVPVATQLVKTQPLAGAAPLPGIAPTTLAGATLPLARPPAATAGTASISKPTGQSAPVVARTPTGQSAPVVSRTPTGQSAPVVSRTPTGQSAPAVARTPTGQSEPVAARPPSGPAPVVPAVRPPSGPAPVVPAVRPPSGPAPLVAVAAALDAAATSAATAASGGLASSLAASPSFGVSPETAETRPEGRGSNQAMPLPPIPAVAATSTRPANLARGSSPQPLSEQQVAPPILPTNPPTETPTPIPSEATEPVVTDTWHDKVSQIRERAHEAAQRAWRRTVTTTATGLQTVKAEASMWRASPGSAAKRWKPTRRAVLTFAGGILAGLILSLIVRAKPTAPAASPPTKTVAAMLPAPPVAQCKEVPKPDESIAATEQPDESIAATPPHQGSSKAAIAHAAAPTTKLAKAAPPANKSIATTKVAPTHSAPVTKASPAIAKTPSAPTTVAKAPTAPSTVAKTPTAPSTVAKTPTATSTVAKTPTAPSAPTTKPAQTAPTTVAKTKPATVMKAAPKPTTKTTGKNQKPPCTGLECI